MTATPAECLMSEVLPVLDESVDCEHRTSPATNGLLTRKVQPEVAQIHAWLRARGSRSRHASSRLLPLVIRGRTGIVDVGKVLLLQPRCASSIFHVYCFWTLAHWRYGNCLRLISAYRRARTGRQNGGSECRVLQRAPRLESRPHRCAEGHSCLESERGSQGLPRR